VHVACSLFVVLLAPTYIPRNFRLIQILDSTTVQFAWDLPIAADELTIRGLLKAYQVIFLLQLCVIRVACACVCSMSKLDRNVSFGRSGEFSSCRVGHIA
jgi:hypothetical protein